MHKLGKDERWGRPFPDPIFSSTTRRITDGANSRGGRRRDAGAGALRARGNKHPTPAEYYPVGTQLAQLQDHSTSASPREYVRPPKLPLSSLSQQRQSRRVCQPRGLISKMIKELSLQPSQQATQMRMPWLPGEGRGYLEWLTWQTRHRSPRALGPTLEHPNPACRTMPMRPTPALTVLCSRRSVSIPASPAAIRAVETASNVKALPGIAA